MSVVNINNIFIVVYTAKRLQCKIQLQLHICSNIVRFTAMSKTYYAMSVFESIYFRSGLFVHKVCFKGALRRLENSKYAKYFDFELILRSWRFSGNGFVVFSIWSNNNKTLSFYFPLATTLSLSLFFSITPSHTHKELKMEWKKEWKMIPTSTSVKLFDESLKIYDKHHVKKKRNTNTHHTLTWRFIFWSALFNNFYLATQLFSFYTQNLIAAKAQCCRFPIVWAAECSWAWKTFHFIVYHSIKDSFIYFEYLYKTNEMLVFSLTS